MDNPVDNYWNIRLKDMKETLEANNFEVFIAPDARSAASMISEQILPKTGGRVISWGGSATFIASGLYETLKARKDVDIIDTFEKDIPKEESLERRRRSLLSDVFITGTNAVTEDGRLVNLDMVGNRVAGITFGPKHVIILAGRNKITADLDDAMFRIQDYAAPANAMRLDKKTPCAKTSCCDDCNSPDRICNYWTITEKSFPKGRIKIVLINQDLGL